MTSIAQKQSLDAKQLQLLQTELLSRQKSPATAWLLLIFGGGLGAHRFYLGRTGSAIAMMLTGGGLGLWTLADLFMLSGMLKQTNEQIEASIIQELRMVKRAEANEVRHNARMAEKQEQKDEELVLS